MRANFLGFTAKAAIPVAACFLAAVLAGVARAGDKPPQLTGRWEFNADESDDAQQKISDAQQNSKDKGNNGGGYPGGGYPGTGSPRVGLGWPMGGIGSPVGGGGTGQRGGTGNHGGSVSREDWDRLAEDPKSLHIDQRFDQVVVFDDSDRAQTLYPDGKEHEDQDASGKKVSTKSEWQRDVLVAEINLSHSTKLTQTFRVSEEGKQLYVVSRQFTTAPPRRNQQVVAVQKPAWANWKSKKLGVWHAPEHPMFRTTLGLTEVFDAYHSCVQPLWTEEPHSSQESGRHSSLRSL